MTGDGIMHSLKRKHSENDGDGIDKIPRTEELRNHHHHHIRFYVRFSLCGVRRLMSVLHSLLS